MKYMGSKRRIAKDIIPIMLKDMTDGQNFYDLFCGGLNLIDKIPKHINRIANDTNKYIIELAKKMQEGWLPNENISEGEFLYIKNNKHLYEDHILGYVGYQLSFGSLWFGSYRKDKIGKRNYSIEAYNNIKRQSENIKNIKLYNLSYDEVELIPKSIIYCDIPYKNTTGYITTKEGFDYDKFYDWCIEKHKEGHKVFISEYEMPQDRFECIWSKEISSSLTKDTGSKKGIEKSFVVKGDL